MELKIKPYHKNSYSKRAILIKETFAEDWLIEIARLELRLDQIQVFPIPGMQPNELYGCLIVFNKEAKINEIGKNQYFQLVENKLFIPENSILSPVLTVTEWQQLFSVHFHLLHQDTGLVELPEAINWNQLINLHEPLEPVLTIPLNSVFIPHSINSSRIEVDAVSLEEEGNPFSEKELAEKLPFNMEKILVGNQREMQKFLQYLDENPEKALKYAIPLDIYNTTRGNNTANFSMRNFSKGVELIKKKDTYPIFAVFLLLYCSYIFVQIMTSGTVDRSISPGIYILVFFIAVFIIMYFFTLLYNSFSSRFGEKGNGFSGKRDGGKVVLGSDTYTQLLQRYEKLALEYLSAGDYQKAAHIYLKLLKNHNKAAQVLEQGNYWAEAAGIYLKYTNNKQKAAECFENGKVYLEAIRLHQELGNYEKAGDLYTILNKKQEADANYMLVIENYKKNHQYLKASLVYRNKIKDTEDAQQLLLDGWTTERDGFNCLNNYFANITDDKALLMSIEHIYNTEVRDHQMENFLSVLKYEYNKENGLKEAVKNIAYEILPNLIEQQPHLASELKFFNKHDTSINKDIMKYKLRQKKFNRD